MSALVLDPIEVQRLIRERRESGADRYDEVWDGVYIAMPQPDTEHQDITTGLATVLRVLIDWAGLGKVFNGLNVSDRVEGWSHNYREPDVAVYLQNSPARDCGTHWCGGPDFAVEVISPDDRSRDKIAFYAAIRTRELLYIDRDPWSLELFRLQGDRLESVGGFGRGQRAGASQRSPPAPLPARPRRPPPPDRGHPCRWPAALVGLVDLLQAAEPRQRQAAELGVVGDDDHLLAARIIRRSVSTRSELESRITRRGSSPST